MHALRPSTSQNKKYDPMPKSAFEVALSQMSNEELLPAVVNREKETLAQRKFLLHNYMELHFAIQRILMMLKI